MSVKVKLKSAYNKIAKMGGYRRALWPEAVSFLKNVKPTTILDIGSGNAHYSSTIESLGHKLIVSDFAKNQLKAARRLGVGNPAMAMDATNLPVKNKRFNVVTAFAVLHHLHPGMDQINFLKEIKRVLRPGGQAFLSVARTSKGGFSANMPFSGINRYYYFFTRSELNSLLEKAKFSSYVIKTSPLKAEKSIIVDGKKTKVKIGNYFIKIKK